jgi:hypothetical protein
VTGLPLTPTLFRLRRRRQIIIQDSHTDAQLLCAHQKFKGDWDRHQLARTTALVQSKHPSPVEQVKFSQRKTGISGREGDLTTSRVEAYVELEKNDIRSATTKVEILVVAVAPERLYAPLEQAEKHSRNDLVVDPMF